jgi:hypothetical protein
MSEKKCKDLVRQEFEKREEDLKIFSDLIRKGAEPETETLGHLHEYGLCIDYVEPGTFTDQKRGFVRYQLSTGGPGDEFRFFSDGTIEYWYLDWFDGASIDVTDNPIVSDIEEYFGIFERLRQYEEVR